jgi:4-amino-4-deoxy-L-arabinose transferase-like glycosyltransferase
MYRRKALPWLAILLLSFALRLIHLEGRDLWYDEAFAVLYASMSPERMIYGTVGPVQGAGAADVHPLLYYSLLHSWMGLAGRSPLAVRFLSVALGMVTVALLVRVAAWSFDRRTGLVVGLLAATNPFHVAYSQEARMYALLGLAAVVAAWGLLRALEEAGGRKQEAGGRREEAGSRKQGAGGKWEEGGGRRWFRWWALYAGAAALTLYAHNLGAFVLLAFHLLAVARRRWWRRWPWPTSSRWRSLFPGWWGCCPDRWSSWGGDTGSPHRGWRS